MTSLEKYYSNPFADDDDETCFAEVDLGQSGDATPVSPLQQRTSQSRAPPAPVSAPSAPTPATLTADRSTSGLMRNGVGASPNTASTAALQRQLDEAHARNQALHDEYGSFIESLREELGAANAKNTDLQGRLAKVESQLRTITIEKETAEWNVKLGKDRIEALESKIIVLEGELASGRGSRARHTAEQEALEAPPPKAGVGGASSLGQPNAAQQRLLQETFSAGGSRKSQPEQRQHDDQAEQQQQQQQQQSTPASGPRRRLLPVTHQEHQQRLQQKQREMQQRQQSQPTHHDPNTPASAMNPPARRTQTTASVQELDSMLLFHSQRRAELTSELQRLDGARLRKAGDKHRAENLEAALEEEDRQIGHIRLLLRSKKAI